MLLPVLRSLLVLLTAGRASAHVSARISVLESETTKVWEELGVLRSIIASQGSRLAAAQVVCNNGTLAATGIDDGATPEPTPRRLAANVATVGISRVGWASDAAVYNGFKMSFANTTKALGVATSTEEVLWFILCGTAGTIMMAGFICIEAGSLPIQDANMAALRSLVGMCSAGVAWWLCGFSFALSGPYDAEGRITNRWIGLLNFAGGGFTGSWTIGDWFVIQPKGVAAAWYMEWILSAATVAIVSGGSAGRFGIMAHCLLSFLIAGFIYPFFVAQLKGGGWMSRTHLDHAVVVDFAGSGFVHLVGGTTALIICIMGGARKGRFSLDGRRRKRLVAGRPPLVAFGTLLIWCGWNGVLAGAPRKLPDMAGVERCAQAIVNTTVAASSGGIMSFILRMVITGLTRKAIVTARAPFVTERRGGSMEANIDPSELAQNQGIPDMRMSMGEQKELSHCYEPDEPQKGLVTRHMPKWSWHVVFGERGINANSVSAGVRAGLASIAAGAGSMHSSHALVVGAVGGGLCELASCVLIIFRIDDPVDAFAAHAVPGFFGLIAAAFFDYGSAEVGASFHGNSGWSCITGSDGKCLQGIWDDAVITQLFAALLFVGFVGGILLLLLFPMYRAGVIKRPTAPVTKAPVARRPSGVQTASSEVRAIQNAGYNPPRAAAPMLAIEGGGAAAAQ